MQNSDIRFQVQFNLNNSPKDCTFVDKTNYSVPPSGTGGITSSFVTGYLKIETPTGTIINNLNTGSDLGTVDIYRIFTDTKSNIALPVNAYGNIEEGTYTFTYQVREWFLGTNDAIVSIDGTAKEIVVAGDLTTEFAGAKYMYISGSTTTANNIPVTFDSVSYVGGFTTLVVNETLTTQAASGNIYVFETVANDYQNSNSLQYSITEPTVSINLQADCRTSQLTSTDASNYQALIDNTYYNPTSTTRVHSITPPSGSGFTPPADTADQVRVLGSNIWTNIWTTVITSTLTYYVEYWDSTPWYIVVIEISGSDNIDVQCSDCACNLFNCIVNLYNKWVTLSNYNTVRAAEVKEALDEIELNFMLYNMASRCGEDPTTYCNAIAAILSSENCTCSSTDPASVEVIPWASAGGGTTATGTVWYNDSGVPSSSLGSDNDYYLNDDTGDYYKKIAGSWVLQGSLKGANASWYNGSGVPAGALGLVGDYYLNDDTGDYYKKTGTTTWTLQGLLSKFVRYYGSFTDSGTAAAIGVQTLKTMNLPANTLSTEGDQVIIEAYVENASGAGDMKFAIEVAGAKIASQEYYNPIMSNKKTWLKAVIDWRSLSSEYGYDWIKDVTAPPVTETQAGVNSYAFDETVVIPISLTAETSLGNLNDIVCKIMTVDVIKK